MRKPVLLHGAYRTDNFGDVLLLTLFYEWIRQSTPNPIVLPFARSDVRRKIAPAEPGLSQAFSRKPACLVYGGGGYLGERPSRITAWTAQLLIRHLVLGLACRATRVPYAFFGVGAGPLTSRVARATVASLVRDASLAVVRDQESAQYLVDYGVPNEQLVVTADTALVLDKTDLPQYATEKAKALFPAKSSGVRIGLHLPRELPDSLDGAQLVTEICQLASSHDAELVMIIDHAVSAGHKLYDSIRQEYSGKVSDLTYSDPWVFSSALGELDLVVTTKLHVGIVATALGVRVVSLAAHPKTPRFYRQIGLPEFCSSIEEYRSGFLASIVASAFSSPAPVIPTPIRDAARKNKKLVQRFVAETVG